MKELSIEQKAKRYDEALEKAKNYHSTETVCNVRIAMENLFPELKESEDERIRNFISNELACLRATEGKGSDRYEELTNAIAWLEKEQKSIWHNEDEEPQRGSLILLVMQSGTPIVAKIIEPNHTFNHGERWAYIDDLLEKQGNEPKVSYTTIVETGDGGINALVTRELPTDGCDDEQKPDDKDEPKFKVGNTIKCKYDDRQFTIKNVNLDKGIYTYTQEGCGNDIDYADEEFELVEQKPAWSEEDERYINIAVSAFSSPSLDRLYHYNKVKSNDLINWLKSLKDRYT